MIFLIGLVSTALAITANAQPAAQSQTAPVISRVEVVAAYPHDDKAFTQGLFFANGRLYESTGKVGASTLRQVNIKTGVPVLKQDLPADIFGEGATAVGERLISLTWRDGKGYVHALETLAPMSEFTIKGEGWGLTYDGARLILSDGTNKLRFLDPETFEETGTLAVTLEGQPVNAINELEWVEGEIFANIWQTDWIVRIDPETGNVTGLIDVSPLFPAARRQNPRDDVPNGIAYEPGSKRLFLTGKNWPALFEVKIIDQ